MINRELRPITVQTYSTSTDAYGQLKTGAVASTRTIDAVVKVQSQTNVQDPRYIDADVIVLTKDNQITDKNVLLIDNVKYQILQIIDAYTNKGWTQILCKKS